MTKQFYFQQLNLQLFAEGAGEGSGGTGAEGATAATETLATSHTKKGVKSNPLANVKYGIQEDAVQTADVQSNTATESVEQPDRNTTFEQLIKGEYKDLYDAKVQDTIQKRLKGTKETVDKYNALSPTLELLAY